jgi:hypothetical protein
VGLGRALLRPGLYDTVVLAGGLDHLTAFPDIMRDGLFDIDVLACLTSPYRYKRMPVVGRRRGNSVDAIVFQQLANVNIRLDLLSVFLLECACSLFDMLPVCIAERHNAHALLFIEIPDVTAALASRADHRKPQVVIRTEDA